MSYVNGVLGKRTGRKPNHFQSFSMAEVIVPPSPSILKVNTFFCVRGFDIQRASALRAAVVAEVFKFNLRPPRPSPWLRNSWRPCFFLAPASSHLAMYGYQLDEFARGQIAATYSEGLKPSEIAMKITKQTTLAARSTLQ